MKKIYLNIALFAFLLSAAININAQKKGYYVKNVKFPANATLQQKVDMAARLVPTKQQLDWQKMELTAFLHFGINTFTGREWGDGKEDPKLFNPTELDAEQWVKSLKETGFKMVILTAKHHDGFCLWPTKTTKHSVESSPWKYGKGDVVKELRQACDKYGMKFGVYLSPWDRNADCYGDSPKYNQFFIEQLTELLTNYGEVHEVWFDGANGEGPNGKKQIYDWDAFYKTIQKLQPKAVMAIMGDDVRWVGNESGLGRETEWSATVLTPEVYSRAKENNGRLDVRNKSKDLGSREILAKATELFWYPSEVDVSIRPGWFYHKSQDSKVKSLRHLMNIYFESVGYNSVLLLNIPPDRRGLINEADVNRLKEFSTYIDKTFSNNFVAKPNVYKKLKEGKSVVYKLKNATDVNVFMLQEDITKGQRVEEFTIEASVNGQWKQIARGTTIGYKRMVRFNAVKTDAIKITINKTRALANISNVGAFFAEEIKETVSNQDFNNIDRKTWKVVETQPITIDLGVEHNLLGFTYAPINADYKTNIAFKYSVKVSLDGNSWTEVISNGEFSNIVNNPIPQTVSFDKSIKARFVKIEATSPNAEKARIEVNELGFKAEK
ncbi:MAG: alpha-L-fucosidase [Bacteroides sp.]|nr:alpha-L-fucosidase [Bacteroides sp.]